MTNPLVELQKLGQSIWYDNIRRGLLASGELKRLVEAGEIRGVTSNPTIFEKAIGGSADYDADLPALVRAGHSAQAIFDALAVEDIRAAADFLRPVYDASDSADGFVSIEVSPLLASDTESTVAEAHRLWDLVDRPNLMVKIPATREGIPAIERCLADGLKINVTLIFSLQRYAEVMDAYLTALERRAAQNLPLDRVASVASFFVSRVDTKVDGLLEEIMRREGPEAGRAAALLGRAAIANAVLAYRDFRITFNAERFRPLRERGAHLQRPLWASTGTKNPAYPDTYYAEALIGPDTVDTLPPATLDAYREHGRPALRIAGQVDDAEHRLQALERLGIRMARVTYELEVEGVAAFAKSYQSLLQTIEARRAAMLPAARPTAKTAPVISAQLGHLEDRVGARLDQLDAQRFLRRLWARDASLWADDVQTAAEIRDRLGWLDVVGKMRPEIADLRRFADEARQAGFTRALLLGMGGSSLCAEVLREALGIRDGYLDLAVLDSTDPAAVRSASRRSDPEHTLFVVASKSGTTIEPNALMAHFWQRVSRKRPGAAGGNFVAITDPGTELDRLAQERGFRRIFRNPPDIGGRFSVLSFFGLVPAALIGADLRALLDRAETAAASSQPANRAADRPGLRLGAILGESALAGRDKMTLVASPGVAAFGDWAEQLIAESTGKNQTGIVPIVGEPIGRPGDYSDDRLFVYLRLGDELDAHAEALARAGHPLVTIHLEDALDLGGEFHRWQVAVAVAGAILRINPFDQPNVKESKDNTSALLEEYAARGALAPERAAWSAGSMAIQGRNLPRGLKSAGSLAEALKAHFERVRPGDYLAFNAFLPGTPAVESALRSVRKAVLSRMRLPTTVGYGPRYLHSTGQLHKGGPDSAVIVQVVADPAKDVPIPGEAFTFGVLERAQAQGDMRSLMERKRRFINVHLPNVEAIGEFSAAVVEALGLLSPQPPKRDGGRAAKEPRAARRPAKPVTAKVRSRAGK